MAVLNTRAAMAVVSTLLITATTAARVPGELVHYSFPYRECTESAWFAESILPYNPDRRLMRAAGLTCMDGHLGARLNYTTNPALMPACNSPPPAPGAAYIPAYLPAATAGSNGAFNVGLDEGFTLEAWVKADPDVSEDRLILSLAAPCPVLIANANDEAELCQDGQATAGAPTGSSISFRLIQTSGGCISAQLQLSGGTCKMAPTLANGFCPPTTPANKIVDANQPYQQIVVAVSKHFGGGTPGSFTPARFRIYIDGVVTVDSEKVEDGSTASIVLESELNVMPVQTLNFSSLFSPYHVLSIGADGYGGPTDNANLYPWAGDVYMLSMYGKALSKTEVLSNLNAGLDNSDPIASNVTFNATEDNCTLLPVLTGAIEDWDVTGLPNRPQPLSARLTSLPTCAWSGSESGGGGCGAIYLDSACSTMVSSASELASYEPSTLFYKPPKDALSFVGSGGSGGTDATPDGIFATIEWEASDNSSGTDSAMLLIRVESVNDPPIAWDMTTPTIAGSVPGPVYMDIPYSITVNGTDVDGADPTKPIAECTIEIVSLPTYGVLRNENCGCTSSVGPCTLSCTPVGGAPLAIGDVVSSTTSVGAPERDGPHLSYRSQTFADTAGMKIVVEDSFAYKLIDAHGVKSVGAATVTIPILSGLDSIWRCASSYNPACVEAAPIVDEEVTTVVTMRGINQAGGETWFVLTRLPTNGTLAFAASGGGAPITSVPTNVSGLSVYNCPAPHGSWKCADVTYTGDLDYFSNPKVTRDGMALNNDDDSFAFTVDSPKGKSAEAEVQVVVNNVNDRVKIIAPNNVTFITSPAAGDPPDQVLESLVLEDPDRGVGYYQVSVTVNLGRLSELTYKQNIVGGNIIAETTKWQHSLNAINDYLGYCPPPCATMGACQSIYCLAGEYGQNVNELKMFATPATAQLFLNALLYKGDSSPGNRVLQIQIDDFDDGVHFPPIEPPGGWMLPASKSVQLIPLVLCNSYIGSSCSTEEQCGGGIITTGIGVAIFAGIAIAWLFVCCRQRSRTGSRDLRGRRKRKEDQAPSDMRCFVPLLATIMLFMVLGFFHVRSGGQMHALRTMDFWGDGYCGPNATRYNFEMERPDYEAQFNNTIYANLTFTGDTSIGFDNMGCTGGVPAAFMVRRMLGDMFILSAAGSLGIIEVSGRRSGRCFALLIAFTVFLLAVVKFGLWEQWLDQIEEGPACNDIEQCPSFITAIPEDQRVDGGPEYALGTCNGRDLRNFQNNMVVAILPAMAAFPAGIIGLIVLCTVWGRICPGADDDDEDDSDSDSDSEDERRHKKKHKKDKHGKRDGKHKKDAKKKDRHRRDRDEDDEERRRRKKKEKEKKKKYASSEEEELSFGEDEEDAKPHPPPKSKKPKDNKKDDVRAPKVPQKKGIGYSKGNKKGDKAGKSSSSAPTDQVAISFVPGAGMGASPVPAAPTFAPPPPVEWFYMDLDNVQQGPTDAAGLKRLYDMGDIHDFTYVWNEEMASWGPYKDQAALMGGPGNLVHTYC